MPIVSVSWGLPCVHPGPELDWGCEAFLEKRLLLVLCSELYLNCQY